MKNVCDSQSWHGVQEAGRRVFLQLLLVFLLFLKAGVSGAQEPSATIGRDSFPEWRISEHAFTVGVGRTHVLDTYLSPIEYAGPEVRLMYEKARPLKRGKGRILSQALVQGHFAYTQNPSKMADEYVGMLQLNFGWHYKIYDRHHLQLYAGVTGDLNAGCFYMQRNSNNPAQAKLYFNAELAGTAVYRFHLKRMWLKVRYQVWTPLSGVMFSPEYGQSYYEIFSLRQGGENVKWTHPLNEPSLRHYVSLDIPFRTYALRLGYMGDFHQSRVNHLKCHTYSHLFMIGVVKRLFILKQKRGMTY